MSLNFICDEFAKGAVARAVTGNNIERYLTLPLEQASVCLSGKKQTTDVSNGCGITLAMHKLNFGMLRQRVAVCHLWSSKM